LTKAGYNVFVAVNGIEALKSLSNGHEIDLVLMDLQMPEMDGYEATEKIRKSTDSSFDPQIPIIALTAHALQSDKERCFQVGMNDFLTKPIDPERLYEVLKKYL
jgi:CheY-like chemotaxis protein